MNGRQLAELHVAKGTRPIIDDIDDLRVTFGFSNIEVITVIVESRLRGGLKTNKPLSLNCTFKEKNGLNIMITFKDTFPSIPLEVVITVESDAKQQLQEFVDQLVNTSNDNDQYIRAVSVVKQVLGEYERLHTNEVVNSSEVEAVDEGPMTAVGEANQAYLEAQQKRLEDLNNTIFTCRMCRQIMFEYSELHPHTAENHFSQKCTSYFLSEPPVHLKLFSQSDAELSSSAADQSGKLLCCHCKASVGHWSWSSYKCSCGEWIAPVFQFVKRKLDVKKKALAAVAAAVEAK